MLNLAVTGTLGAATDVSVTLGGPDAGATAGAQHMAFRGFEILDITTNTGDDTVRADNFDDRIDVWSGANVVRALGGNDVVSYRTSDANYLNGGAGEDTLFVVEADPIVSLGFSVNGAHATDGSGSVLLNFEHYSVIGGLHDLSGRVALGQHQPPQGLDQPLDPRHGRHHTRRQSQGLAARIGGDALRPQRRHHARRGQVVGQAQHY